MVCRTREVEERFREAEELLRREREEDELTGDGSCPGDTWQDGS